MIRIALVDGPLGGADNPARRHGRAMRSAILSACPAAEILAIPVFDTGLSTSVARVASALAAAAGTGSAIVHCSFGLARADAALKRELELILARGAQIVAARPARGAGIVWPAEHPAIFAVQGDARCGPGDWSLLGRHELWFGACPHLDDDPTIAGASVAAAHFTGLLAARMEAPPPARRLPEMMAEGARWVGRERRTVASRQALADPGEPPAA